MADLSWHQNRVRAGARGGQENFSWDKIKQMDYKERDHYLGGSTMMGLQGNRGVFQTNNWWQSTRGDAKKLAEEREAVQAFEEEAMLEVLGEKSANITLQKQKLTAEQMRKALLKGDAITAENPHAKIPGTKKISVEEASSSGAGDGEVSKGLGFNQWSTAEHERKKLALLGNEGTLAGTNPFVEEAFGGGNPSNTQGPAAPPPQMSKADALLKYTGGVDVGEYQAQYAGNAEDGAAANGVLLAGATAAPMSLINPKNIGVLHMWTEADDFAMERADKENPENLASADAPAPIKQDSPRTLLKRKQKEDRRKARREARWEKKEKKKRRKKKKKEEKKVRKQEKKRRKKDKKKKDDSSSDESSSDSSSND